MTFRLLIAALPRSTITALCHPSPTSPRSLEQQLQDLADDVLLWQADLQSLVWQSKHLRHSQVPKPKDPDPLALRIAQVEVEAILEYRQLTAGRHREPCDEGAHHEQVDLLLTWARRFFICYGNLDALGALRLGFIDQRTFVKYSQDANATNLWERLSDFECFQIFWHAIEPLESTCRLLLSTYIAFRRCVWRAGFPDGSVGCSWFSDWAVWDAAVSSELQLHESEAALVVQRTKLVLERQNQRLAESSRPNANFAAVFMPSPSSAAESKLLQLPNCFVGIVSSFLVHPTLNFMLQRCSQYLLTLPGLRLPPNSELFDFDSEDEDEDADPCLQASDGRYMNCLLYELSWSSVTSDIAPDSSPEWLRGMPRVVSRGYDTTLAYYMLVCQPGVPQLSFDRQVDLVLAYLGPFVKSHVEEWAAHQRVESLRQDSVVQLHLAGHKLRVTFRAFDTALRLLGHLYNDEWDVAYGQRPSKRMRTDGSFTRQIECRYRK